MGRRYKRRDPESANKKPRTAEDGTNIHVGDGYTIRKDNFAFEEFYRRIIPAEEWDSFWSTVKRPLATCFRITGSRSTAFELRDRLEQDFFSRLQDIQIDDVRVEPPRPLTWYPDNLAWQVDANRQTFRRSPVYKELHEFLVSETSLGNISRQESVSMIPPLLLDVQADHFVLDMCAAPGSKTTQLIEAMHQSIKAQGELPQGIVIANDVDSKRSYTLVHQAKRLNSPCLLVTNHDASQFPRLDVKEEVVDRSGDTMEVDGPLMFDRILADVPCSGDGTLRKNPAIWRHWLRQNAFGLHRMQLSILKRAFQLLKPGGRMVYSTCSMHPLENEAVVAAALQMKEGESMRLVDVSAQLPSLQRKPGLTSWNVYAGRSGDEYVSFEQVPPKERKEIRETMFPGPPDVMARLGLTHCLRVYPHLQDTGGFFVAVLEKAPHAECVLTKEEVDVLTTPDQTDEAQVVEVEEEVLMEDTTALTVIQEPNQEANQEQEEEPQFSGFKESPYIILAEDDPILQQISQFYQIDSQFPCSQFLVRSENGKRNILYLVSKSVCSMLFRYNVDRLKIVNTGVKALVRLDSGKEVSSLCDYRLHHDVLPLIYPHLSDARIVSIDKEDLRVGISQDFPKFEAFSDQAKSKFENLPLGGFVLLYPSEKGPDVVLSALKARTSINVLLNRQERLSLTQRLK